MRRDPAGQPEVQIVSPAAPSANNGNARTAERWQGFLAPVTQCRITQRWDGRPADVLVALHAGRSADSIAAFRAAHRHRPIAVVLTGTDLYGDFAGDVAIGHSLECASRLVLLQSEGLARLAAADRAKAVVIVQSAPARRAGQSGSGNAPATGFALADADPGSRPFVAVGHLRAEKDPLTLMRAARLLGPPLCVDHLGAALDESLGRAAEATVRECAGYRWLGAATHAEARRRIAGARALVHMSRVEGGANVVIEAIRSGVPVLASRIDGNVGLLGRDYEGYFEVGDAAALAAAMRRLAEDPVFAARLTAQCEALAPLFAPARERAAVRGLIASLLAARAASR